MEEYHATWTSPGVEIGRQIDYIAVNAKYRNAARKAQNNVYWHVNMKQDRQRRVQTTQLRYNAAQKYENRYRRKPGDTSDKTSKNSEDIQRN